MAGFGISGVKKPLCSAARELISKMDLREMGCEDGSWIELALRIVSIGSLWY